MKDYNIEYKLDIPKKNKDLKAEIVAFLNSNGGTILLGVDDLNGKPNEILIAKKKKEWENILSNWIVNAFSPAILIFSSVKPSGKLPGEYIWTRSS